MALVRCHIVELASQIRQPQDGLEHQAQQYHAFKGRMIGQSHSGEFGLWSAQEIDPSSPVAKGAVLGRSVTGDCRYPASNAHSLGCLSASYDL